MKRSVAEHTEYFNKLSSKLPMVYMQFRLTNSQRYLVVGLVGLAGLVVLGLPLTVTIRVSRASAMVSGLAGCQSTCHTVNTSPGRLVTQSTRHKEAVNSPQANKQANIKAVLPQQYNYP